MVRKIIEFYTRGLPIGATVLPKVSLITIAADVYNAMRPQSKPRYPPASFIIG